MDSYFFSLAAILAVHIMSVPPGERVALAQLVVDLRDENNA